MRFRGLNKVVANIKSKANDTDKGVEEGVEKATLLLLREVKQSIAGRKSLPVTVDTSLFLSSTYHLVKGKEGAVYNDVEYAPWIEFGTVKMTKRPHFRTSKNRIQDKINAVIGNVIKNNIK